MTAWGWRPERTKGIWRHGAGWLRPLVAASPYLTVGLLVLMFHLVGGTLTASKGLLFDLPEGGKATDAALTDLVALVMPMRHDIVVFFDDARYLLSSASSVKALGEHLAERTGRGGQHTILVLADRRVSGGDLMKFADVARQNGARRILFAEKGAHTGE